MYVIMVYDVGVERVTKVLKIARRYLGWVQNSVLEGELSNAQFRRLQREVQRVIQKDHDRVLFYLIRSAKDVRRESLGAATSSPPDFFA